MAKKSNTWFIISMILIGVLVVGGGIFGLITFGKVDIEKGIADVFCQKQGLSSFHSFSETDIMTSECGQVELEITCFRESDNFYKSFIVCN